MKVFLPKPAEDDSLVLLSELVLHKLCKLFICTFVLWMCQSQKQNCHISQQQ